MTRKRIAQYRCGPLAASNQTDQLVYNEVGFYWKDHTRALTLLHFDLRSPRIMGRVEKSAGKISYVRIHLNCKYLTCTCFGCLTREKRKRPCSNVYNYVSSLYNFLQCLRIRLCPSSVSNHFVVHLMAIPSL
ncbi:unnamed protein product [Prorocentrum cordatum]|uniref:Uncharacterized protein n=1 Tax=Prorocentrum cordatum TaxID=2364126 RepID=A0ABN9QJ51_9DINO|nr:unnamed protein product [Polarella glacialis]|mmetsp:Transcript_46767/g.130288  ORF Transcript_46767/g.130288 Transcript_46767/m.130288 type:complete len:132 (-) Transcript_46767:77-472(-)